MNMQLRKEELAEQDIFEIIRKHLLSGNASELTATLTTYFTLFKRICADIRTASVACTTAILKGLQDLDLIVRKNHILIHRIDKNLFTLFIEKIAALKQERMSPPHATTTQTFTFGDSSSTLSAQDIATITRNLQDILTDAASKIDALTWNIFLRSTIRKKIITSLTHSFDECLLALNRDMIIDRSIEDYLRLGLTHIAILKELGTRIPTLAPLLEDFNFSNHIRSVQWDITSLITGQQQVDEDMYRKIDQLVSEWTHFKQMQLQLAVEQNLTLNSVVPGTKIHLKDAVFVHMTNFFPLDMIIHTTLSASGDVRDSIHFTIDTTVEDRGSELWKTCSFAILIPGINFPIHRIKHLLIQDTFIIGNLLLLPGTIIVGQKHALLQLAEKEQIPLVTFISRYAAKGIKIILIDEEKTTAMIAAQQLLQQFGRRTYLPLDNTLNGGARETYNSYHIPPQAKVQLHYSSVEKRVEMLSSLFAHWIALCRHPDNYIDGRFYLWATPGVQTAPLFTDFYAVPHALPADIAQGRIDHPLFNNSYYFELCDIERYARSDPTLERAIHQTLVLFNDALTQWIRVFGDILENPLYHLADRDTITDVRIRTRLYYNQYVIARAKIMFNSFESLPYFMSRYPSLYREIIQKIQFIKKIVI